MLPPIIEVWLFDVSLAAGSELQLPDLFRTELPPPFLWCLSEGSSSAQADLPVGAGAPLSQVAASAPVFLVSELGGQWDLNTGDEGRETLKNVWSVSSQQSFQGRCWPSSCLGLWVLVSTGNYSTFSSSRPGWSQ